MRINKEILAMLAASSVCAASPAYALDSSREIICAATTVYVCDAGSDCVTGAPGAVNLPTFWHIDPGARVISSKQAIESRRTSPIDIVAEEGGHIVLQGSDEGFAWSISIAKETGRMLATAGRETGYLVFGECTTP